MKPKKSFRYEVFAPDPGDVVRIVLDYAGTLRPILWFEVSAEGSIYFGPRSSNATALHSRELKVIGGRADFDYMDLAGPRVTDPEVVRKAKYSVHTSGLINTGADRLARTPLWSLEKQELVSVFLFRHPREYGTIVTARRTDLCHRYPIDEECPLRGQLHIAPIGRDNPVTVPEFQHQVNIAFQYKGLRRVPDCVLQLVLGHSEKNTWPPLSWVLLPIFEDGARPPLQPSVGDAQPIPINCAVKRR